MSANTPVSSVSVNDSDTFNLSDAAEQMPDATDNQESPAVTAPAAPPAAPTTPAAPSTKPNGKPSPTPAEKTNPGRGGAKPPKKGPPKSPSGGKATPRNKKGLPKTDPKALPRTIKYIEPPGKEMSLPLKELTLDRRIQMRAALIDEQTVERYKADYQDDDFRDKIPPVKVIELTQDDADRLKLPSRYVVWDGFQRCEARKRAGLKDIPAIVAKGTWGTAVVLALSANSKHGLTRTIADVRKTLMRIIDSQQLQDSILATAAKVGGANRALAAAVQCSKGFVSKVLNSMGKTTRGDKIVNLPESNKTTKRHKRTQGDPAAAMRVESREIGRAHV